MHRQSIGSIIEKINEMKKEVDIQIGEMLALLVSYDPETYSKFLKFPHRKCEVIDTPKYIEIEIANFDFDQITGMKEEDLSGRCIRFIFLVDGMFTDEFDLPVEFVNNFNYVSAWARQKVERKEQLNNLIKEFKN